VYFALGSALLTLLVTHNLRSTISVIIVAGACGIAAGTPLAILGAIGRAARQGAIIKGGVYLEQLAKIDTVLLDKTGTLTYGKPGVSSIESASGYKADEVLRIAAAAERNSEHPLVGVVMGSGTEIAHASANVLLIGNDLRKFASTLKTARWCRTVILQNFYGRLVVDALGIALAAVGMINR